jgi:hypothetical protein
MDNIGLFSHMMHKQRSSLASYLTTLQSEGRIAFTRDGAIKSLGIGEVQLVERGAAAKSQFVAQGQITE